MSPDVEEFSHLPLRFPAPGGPRLRVGIDMAPLARIEASLARFGRRFLQRLYTPQEVAYAEAAPLLTVERLAARFAAKEAVIKALDLSALGVNWRDIEVCRQPGGGCELALHGRAAAQARRLGVVDAALSLSHDGGQAVAMVVCLLSSP